MLTFKQLHHATALQIHGSFSNAAKALNMSQPALSRSIQSLEVAVGTRLFDRVGTRVEPTAFGLLVLSKADTIGWELEALRSEIAQLKGLTAGTLTVAMGSNAAELSGNEAIGKMVGRYPDIELQVKILGWREVAQQIIDRQVDIGLAELSGARDDGQFQVESIGRHPVSIICRKKHPLCKLRKVTIEDIKPYKLVVPLLPQRVANALTKSGIIVKGTGEAKTQIEADSYQSISEIIRYSDSLTFAALKQLTHWRKPSDFHALSISESWMHLDYGFISLRNRSPSPITEIFKETVRKIEGIQG